MKHADYEAILAAFPGRHWIWERKHGSRGRGNVAYTAHGVPALTVMHMRAGAVVGAGWLVGVGERTVCRVTLAECLAAAQERLGGAA